MTPILQTLIPLVTSYGTHKAVQFLEGAEELALADDDLTSFLARRAVEWDQLETADQDSLRDAYLEAIKWECARRLTPRDPASLFSRMEAALRAAGPELDHLHRTGQPLHSFSHLETLTLGIGDLIAELNRIPTASDLPVSSPSTASGVIPAPLVPDAVKVAHEVSVCEVEPLGEIMPDGGWVFEGSPQGDIISIRDSNGNLSILIPNFGPAWISKDETRSLIAHLTAWLATGSFDLKGLPSSPPSSEGKEPGISIGYLEPVQYEIIKELCRSFHLLGAPIGIQAALGSWGDTLTDEEVLELLQAENAQASTTPQKGGQGV